MKSLGEYLRSERLNRGITLEEISREQDIDRVFDVFFTTSSNGMGMGLAISRSIIESHGGRIWAANNPQKGVTIHFVLPLETGTNDER